jgi:mannose-6-phosphate isomerase-like protein (cupin superfamily)
LDKSPYLLARAFPLDVLDSTGNNTANLTNGEAYSETASSFNGAVRQSFTAASSAKSKSQLNSLEDKIMKMKRVAFGVLVVLLTFITLEGVTFSDSSTPPNIAFDITKADIDTLLKNAPPAVDQQLRVVDMGKYNLAVGIIHRGPTNDKTGDPITGPYHDQTAETYIMLSGSGILTTGGTMVDKKPSPNYSILNGPGGSGTAGNGAYSRKVQAGDVVIIPPGVLHAWSQITDHVTYLSVRPDPDRVLPGGYVNPLLLRNLPQPAK